MKFIADFHIHSRFSRATSKNLVPEEIDYWAGLKGIDVVGTGDCTHPGWLAELEEKLETAEGELYRLKKNYRIKNRLQPKGRHSSGKTRFLLTGEVSSIYKKGGKVRKVHNICIFPDFEAARKFQRRLARIGNIESDGRPTLGLDSKDLLEMVLRSSPDSHLIPAHIWTPWFSILGSKSGFDSVHDCFEELTPHIFALETGLSSDPPMNRLCSFLDRFRLVSNSDAHSPEKLGREANLFDTKPTYKAIFDALKSGDGFLGTIEFFPQQGKYHYDGHRKCNVCWSPQETLEHHGICPNCGKPVTKGVMHRVTELADRSGIGTQINKEPFYSITPLAELLAQLQGRRSSTAKSVTEEYFRLIYSIGTEFHILLFAEIEEIRQKGGPLTAHAIKQIRAGDLSIKEGFDGEFGKVTVFEKSPLPTLPLFDEKKVSEKSKGQAL